MSYKVTYGEAQTYPTAWRDCRGGGKLYVSWATRLTPAIKRAIVEDVLPQDGGSISNSEIDSLWNSLPMSKWTDVTIRPLHVVNEDDPTEFRLSMDYTHTRGTGDIETERVCMLR